MAEDKDVPKVDTSIDKINVAPIWLQAVNSLSVMLLLAAAVIFGVISLQNGAHHALPIFIILLFGISGFHWIVVKRQQQDFMRLRALLNKDVKDGLGKVEKKASELLASRVDVLAKRSDVLTAMADVYSDAAERAKEKKLLGTFEQPEFILLFGASSIQPRVDEPLNSSETDETPTEKLNKARLKAEQQGVRFRRYVRLFDKQNYLGRSKDIRDAYLVWLEAQISLLKGSPLHTLYNARRAPRWKAIRSSVCSDTAFIDILGDGEFGFRIKGEQFAKSQKDNARDYINDPSGGRQAIIETYSQDKVHLLEQHLKEMKELNISSQEKSNGE